MDPFIGEIRMFGGTFAPRGWAFCHGQLLSIPQYDALFSLLGTIYGGDGRTTFGLPDLRGRIPLHMGTGPGLSARSIGQKSGAETVTLNTSQMPAHKHTPMAQPAAGDAEDPSGKTWASSGGGDPDYGGPVGAVAMAPEALGQTGGSQSHSNMHPFLNVSFIIALVGVYPSRN